MKEGLNMQCGPRHIKELKIKEHKKQIMKMLFDSEKNKSHFNL